ncbi:phenoloxidase subunit 2-like [Hyposmocoma kahamanoa]|uniref:phenoloxidase subunit 2-like n=1 Tax=Hyposmocoma kahamanoa TaxID=1477025 RepID=UPI000E6D94E0|nr:phenoloxidase subunit 2-like [Hyposmocoma kahamanoa]
MADELTIKSLTLLFDRPNEPLITPKGENNTIFQLTDQFIPPDYENNGLDLNNRYGEDASETIPLKNLSQVPQFPLASQLPPDAEFSLFLPKHQAMASEVIDVLMNVPENQFADFVSTCAYARVHLNSQLFNYCFSVALMHRRDTRNVPIPNFAETFPSKFMDSQVFQQARESTRILEGNERNPIIIPRDYTATDLEEEHRVSYWREDIGINLHHWHWHLVYPFTSSNRAIVAKDRRGELFFYMHQQVIARYNCERLDNSLKRVAKFSNFNAPIPEAYFPKLDSLTSARGWPPRQSGMRWQDLKRPADGLNVTLADMERWKRSISEVISTGKVRLANGGFQDLDIDTLGNIIEASILSPNPQLYGSLHNNGHMFAGYMHDPSHRYLENFAVMADEATNMRDPFFYCWHAYIDDLFQQHKQSPYVSPYSISELMNPGVRVQSVTIENLEGDGQPNTLNTFWMQSDLDLSRGLDFSNRGPVFARYTHLNHRRFRYVIGVNNTGNARRTTVRIFLGPKFDERNLPWILADQRKMFLEMDRFVTPLKAGQNTITRDSTESSLTIPFEQTFRDLSAQGQDPRVDALAAFNFCGCGWPQHMLVPRGTVGGAQYQLFVMLSNYDFDKLDQADGRELSCKEASSFCGLRDRLFPDKRAMGFPFDRPSTFANNIEDFILSNMALQDVTIKLQNSTEPNPRNPRQ